MIDKKVLEAQLSELPLYTYFYTDPKNIEFSDEKKSADPVKKACKNKGEMAKIP